VSSPDSLEDALSPDAGTRLPHGSLFTTERRTAIIAHIREGAQRYCAAERVGIGERTIRRWTAKGRDNIDSHDRDGMEVDAYGEFYVALLEAESTYNAKLLGIVTSAALTDKDVKAAQWLLERRQAKRYGSRALVGIERTDHDDEPVDLGDAILEKLDDLATKAAALESDEEDDGAE